MASLDFLVMMITVPLMAVNYVVRYWSWGTILCTSSQFIKNVSLGVSAFSLVALSGDRLFAMYAGSNSGGSMRMTIVISLSIWVLAIICAIPAILESHVKVNLI